MLAEQQHRFEIAEQSSLPTRQEVDTASKVITLSQSFFTPDGSIVLPEEISPEIDTLVDGLSKLPIPELDTHKVIEFRDDENPRRDYLVEFTNGTQNLKCATKEFLDGKLDRTYCVFLDHDLMLYLDAGYAEVDASRRHKIFDLKTQSEYISQKVKNIISNDQAEDSEDIQYNQWNEKLAKEGRFISCENEALALWVNNEVSYQGKTYSSLITPEQCVEARYDQIKMMGDDISNPEGWFLQNGTRLTRLYEEKK